MNVTHVQLCMIYALNRQKLVKNSPTLTKPSHAKVMPYALIFFSKIQGDDEDIIDESSKKQVVNDLPILFNKKTKELQKYYI